MMSWFSDLSNKAKMITTIGSAILMLTAAGGAFYNVFAKDAEFKEFVAEYRYDKDMERLHWLEEQIERYKKLYGENLENASKEQLDRHKRWMIELRLLWKKIEKNI